jgi:hypothetical protein
MEDKPSRAPSEAELARARRRCRHPRLRLSRQGAQGSWPVREARSQDAESLGRLMHDAYRGIVDDEGETLEQSVAEARERTIDALLDQGYEELDLFVTRTKEPAVRIYERLGFRDVEGWSLPAE